MARELSGVKFIAGCLLGAVAGFALAMGILVYGDLKSEWPTFTLDETDAAGA